MPVRPYGTWPSPVDAELVASSGGIRIADVDIEGERVRWAESRPAEGGRFAVVHCGHGKTFTLEVLGKHLRELDVIVCEKDRRHGADDTGRPVPVHIA